MNRIQNQSRRRAIASCLGVSRATVSRVLKRAGLSKLSDLRCAEPVQRYEREQPGELLHIDIKKLWRFDRIGHLVSPGQEYVRPEPPG